MRKISNKQDVRGLVADADRARDEKQWAAAVEIYGRYLRLRPKDAGIWVQYGHSLKESGNLAAADAAYFEALRRRPRDADTYLQIGHLRRLQQRPSAALFWYQLALDLEPEHGHAGREVETLTTQRIVPAPERLPVSWVRDLTLMVRRVRWPLVREGRAGLEVAPARPDAESLDPFERAWRHYLPSFVEAASNMAALGHEYARLRKELDRRLSEQDAAIRREIAALREQIEMMRGASTASNSMPRPVTSRGARIIDVDRVEAAKRNGLLQLQIGSGGTSLPDHIMVDTSACAGADIVGAADSLPFDMGTVDAIVVSKILERFSEGDLEHRLLPYWLSLLKPGGCFVAIVPDGVAMIAGAADGTISFTAFRSMMFKRDSSNGASPVTLFSCDGLVDLLQRTGFRNVHIPARARSNGVGLEFEIRAQAPE